MYIILLFLIIASLIDYKWFRTKSSIRIIFWTFILILYFLPLIFENPILPYGSYGVIGLIGAIALPVFYIMVLYKGIRSKII